MELIFLFLLQDDKSFWEALEKNMGSSIPSNLKNILSFMGYSCTVALKNFDSAVHIPKIEKFMRDKLHKMIPQTQYEDYYGKFKADPKEFELMGYELVLKGISDFIQRTKGDGKATSSLRQLAGISKETNLGPTSKSTLQSDECEKLKESDHLSKILGKWLEDNHPNFIDAEDVVPVAVAKDGLGIWTAKIHCPIDGCDKEILATKSGSRWNHNFYKHIKLRHSSPQKKSQINICEMLGKSANRNPSEESGDSTVDLTDKCSPNSNSGGKSPAKTTADTSSGNHTQQNSFLC